MLFEWTTEAYGLSDWSILSTDCATEGHGLSTYCVQLKAKACLPTVCNWRPWPVYLLCANVRHSLWTERLSVLLHQAKTDFATVATDYRLCYQSKSPVYFSHWIQTVIKTNHLFTVATEYRPCYQRKSPVYCSHWIQTMLSKQWYVNSSNSLQTMLSKQMSCLL